MFAKTLWIAYNYFMKKEVKKNEDQWDKKKILLFFIASILLLVIGYQIKTVTLGENFSLNKDSVNVTSSDVKGASATNQPQKDLKKDIQVQIDSLKSDAEDINLIDIASSSPQVQKLINDLKTLQDYPTNQLRDVCEKVCRNF